MRTTFMRFTAACRAGILRFLGVELPIGAGFGLRTR
jgi:hypothetical protein